jgi:hypothetical protein
VPHHLAVGDLRGEVTHPAAHQIKDSAACVAGRGRNASKSVAACELDPSNASNFWGAQKGWCGRFEAPPELPLSVGPSAFPIAAAGAVVGLLLTTKVLALLQNGRAHARQGGAQGTGRKVGMHARQGP